MYQGCTWKYNQSMTLRERFFFRTEVTDGCWRWTGRLFKEGYGAFNSPRSTLAHRWIYKKVIGPIPDGLVIDHLCRNRWCVNPYHLEPVTLKENLRRGQRDRGNLTHCRRGHEYTTSNTKVDKYGKRYCKTCCAQWERDKTARLREERNRLAEAGQF